MGEVIVEEEPLHWHYASTAGLLGILSSSSLWASHAATLNDSTEIRYGMDLVRSRVPRRPKEVAAWRALAEATSPLSGARFRFIPGAECRCSGPQFDRSTHGQRDESEQLERNSNHDSAGLLVVSGA